MLSHLAPPLNGHPTNVCPGFKETKNLPDLLPW